MRLRSTTLARRLALASALPCALVGAAAAQVGAPRQAHVTRTDTPPTIDGHLDEPAWQTATPIGELVQFDPDLGVPPSESSDIRFLYDADFLYIGLRFFDRDPSGIIATTRERDVTLDADDRFKLVLDTFHDHRSAFYFVMNAAGSKSDALINDNGRDFNRPWDGIWDGSARIDELGWTAELAIPFKTLSFRPGESTWGFNIERHIGQRREDARWTDARRDSTIFDVGNAGELSGLVGIRQGIGLDVVPFFVSDWKNDEVAEETDLFGELGVDAFYKITPNLTLSLTANTDFAETEVDDRQINLTRFPLFFPERRDFFLQDAGLFGFAGFATSSNTNGSRDLIPFFSRRIGLSDSGEEVPILVGGKLTGRVGGTNVGVLDVQTDATDDVDGQNLFVARISHNVGEQSTLGGIATFGDPASSDHNALLGFDANYRTASFRGDKTLAASAWVLGTEDETSGDALAFGASAEYPNDLWQWNLEAKQIPEDFDAALGFVPRTGIRKYAGALNYGPRLEGAVRQLDFGADGELFTDLDGDLETYEVGVTPLGVEWDSGDELALRANHVHDELTEDFEISDGIFVPTGAYDYDRFGVDVASSTNRPWGVALSLTAGTFFDGTATEHATTLSWRSGPLFTTSVEYEQSDVHLPDGDFQTQVARLRTKFSFTPEISWNSFVQWDNESDSFGINSRLRWIPTPLHEIFLVFNETLDGSGDDVSPASQELAFKIGTTFRF